MRIGVLELTQAHTDRPKRFVSKPEAKILLRRLFAERISQTLIRLCKVRSYEEILASKLPTASKPVKSMHYEHHIEPRLISLRDSEFNQYLRGY